MGVRIGVGIVVKTIVAGEGLSVRVIPGVFVKAGVITGDSGSAVVGILEGSPRSMKMSLLAAD